MLQRQHRSDAAFAATQSASLPTLDYLQGVAVATGGGRRRPTHRSAE